MLEGPGSLVIVKGGVARAVGWWGYFEHFRLQIVCFGQDEMYSDYECLDVFSSLDAVGTAYCRCQMADVDVDVDIDKVSSLA